MLIPKTRRIKDKAHVKFVATLPCCISGSEDVQAHHLLRNVPRGMGMKAGDNFVVPLSVELHRQLHDVIGDERAFFKLYNINGRALADSLYENSKDRSACLEILEQCQELVQAP